MQAIDPACGISIDAQARILPLARQPARRSIQAEMMQLLGQTTPPLAKAGGTEAGIFQRAGIPALIVGPGHSAQAHQPDEYVEESQLDGCAAILRKAAATLRVAGPRTSESALFPEVRTRRPRGPLQSAPPLHSANPHGYEEANDRATMSLDRRRSIAATRALRICGALDRQGAGQGASKIAVLLPRSGVLAQAGQSCYRGAIAAPKVLADLGYNVQLVQVDTDSSPDSARTQAEKAINGEGAQCIVCAIRSRASTLAIAQVTEQRQIPLVVNIAAAPQVTEQGYKYLVRNFQTGGQLVTNGLRLIKEIAAATKVDFKSAVFIHVNDTFGAAQAQAMSAIFPTQNMPFKIVDTIAYDLQAQDLSVEVTKLRADNPWDLVLSVTHGRATPSSCVREMVRQRFCAEGHHRARPRPASMMKHLHQALGPLSDFVMFTLPWANPKSSMTQALEASFNAR